MVTINVYTMPMCRFCSWIKTVLINKGVRFTEINLLEYRLKNKIVTDNSLKAPMIEIDNKVIIAFDKNILEKQENPISQYYPAKIK